MRIAERVRAWWRNSSRGTRASVAACVAVLVFGCAVFVLTPKRAEPAPSMRSVSFTEFWDLAKGKRLKSATVGKWKVFGTTTDGEKIVMPHDGWLLELSLPRQLNELGVEVGFDAPKDDEAALKIVSILTSLGSAVMFVAIMTMILLQLRGSTTLRWPEVVKDSKTRFSDVAGQIEPKAELQELKSFIVDRGDYERVGAKAPKGVLLVGPPGTGKTLLAKALAGESGASFIAVSGSDFSSMFVGVGRARVKKLFRAARRKKPCIVFIDEIDGLAKKRGGSTTDVARDGDNTLNQLLVEMDGFEPLDGVTVVAATNRADVLDPAILRRFNRHIHVGLPTVVDRGEILRVHVAERPLAGDVDLDRIARGTPGFSGADLANLVNEAAVLAARRARSRIADADFDEARDKVLMGLKRESLVLDEDERRLVAYHEGGHALAACRQKESDPVHQATIVPRGHALGLVMRFPLKDRVVVRRSKLEADLTVLLAGRAAEEIVFGIEHVSNGAASDIEQATDLARNMVTQWGLGTRGSLVRMAEDSPQARADIRRIVDLHYEKAKALIAENREALDRVANALLELETIDGEELRAIVEGGQEGSLRKPLGKAERTEARELAAFSAPAAGSDVGNTGM